MDNIIITTKKRNDNDEEYYARATAIALLVYCGKVESTISSHLRGRHLHKDIVVRYKDHPQPQPEDEDLDLCIDLGRKYGKTYIHYS